MIITVTISSMMMVNGDRHHHHDPNNEKKQTIDRRWTRYKERSNRWRGSAHSTLQKQQNEEEENEMK